MKLVIPLIATAWLAVADDSANKRYHNSAPVRLWPLLEVLDYGQPPTREVEALWPLLDWESGRDKKRLHMFPLIWYGDKPGDRYLFVVPLFGQRKKANCHADLFFPLFSTVRGGAELEPYALVPHLATRVNTDREQTVRVLGPMLRFGRGNPGKENAYTITDVMNLGGLLKLVEHRSNEKATNLGLLAALPLERPKRAPMSDTRIEVLSALDLHAISHRRGEDWARTHIFPFFWKGHHQRGDYVHVWPLFGLHRKGEHERQYSVAWPLLIYKRNVEKGRRFFSFPLGLAGYNERPKHRCAWLVPLGLFSKSADGHFIRMLMPLYLDWGEENHRGRFIIPFHGFFEDGKAIGVTSSWRTCSATRARRALTGDSTTCCGPWPRIAHPRTIRTADSCPSGGIGSGPAGRRICCARPCSSSGRPTSGPVSCPSLSSGMGAATTTMPTVARSFSSHFSGTVTIDGTTRARLRYFRWSGGSTSAAGNSAAYWSCRFCGHIRGATYAHCTCGRCSAGTGAAVTAKRPRSGRCSGIPGAPRASGRNSGRPGRWSI